jgi:hypothetical protein
VPLFGSAKGTTNNVIRSRPDGRPVSRMSQNVDGEFVSAVLVGLGMACGAHMGVLARAVQKVQKNYSEEECVKALLPLFSYARVKKHSVRLVKYCASYAIQY